MTRRPILIAAFVVAAVIDATATSQTVLYSHLVDNAPPRGLRLATGTPTDRLGQFLHAVDYNDLGSVTLKLSQIGTVTGNVWVRIKYCGIRTSGMVLSTSAPVDAASIASGALVTFTLPLPITIKSSHLLPMIVMEGDYARSDANYIAWHGDNRYGADAYEWNGISSNPSPTVDTFAHELSTVVLAPGPHPLPSPTAFPRTPCTGS